MVTGACSTKLSDALVAEGPVSSEPVSHRWTARLPRYARIGTAAHIHLRSRPLPNRLQFAERRRDELGAVGWIGTAGFSLIFIGAGAATALGTNHDPAVALAHGFTIMVGNRGKRHSLSFGLERQVRIEPCRQPSAQRMTACGATPSVPRVQAKGPSRSHLRTLLVLQPAQRPHILGQTDEWLLLFSAHTRRRLRDLIDQLDAEAEDADGGDAA